MRPFKLVASTTFPVFSCRLGLSVLIDNVCRHSDTQFYSLTSLNNSRLTNWRRIS